MAKETKQVEVVEEEKANRQMPKNRRYVGSQRQRHMFCTT